MFKAYIVCIAVAVVGLVSAGLMASAIFLDAVDWEWKTLLWPLGLTGGATVAGVTVFVVLCVRDDAW